MVCAKGFGLDSGDKIYYVLAVIAIPFWIAHMISMRWEQSSLLFSIILFCIAMGVTVAVRRSGIILSIMAIIAVKDVDKEKVLDMVLHWWFFCITIMLLCVFLGVIEDKIVAENGKVWHGMGYSTGNIFHATVGILIILYMYKRKSRITGLEVFIFLIINYVVYLGSASRSGFIIGVFALFSGYGLKLIKESANIRRWVRVGLCAGMLLIIISSFILPLLYNGDWGSNSLPSVLNRALTGRIQHARTVLASDPVKLWGNSENLSAFIDNAYVFLAMKYGIMITVTIGMLYIVAVKNMLKRDDDYGIYLVFMFTLYGFTEQFFVNSFMNYSLIIVGNDVYKELSNNPKSECS